MNIFIDTNIVIAVLNKEYPLFPHVAKILSMHGQRRFQIFTSPLCLAIGFYFAEKKSGREIAMKKIEIFSRSLSVTNNMYHDVAKVFGNRKITDFEDGLQYYSALDSKCKCIITVDVGDYYFSEIDIVRPEDFFVQYNN